MSDRITGLLIAALAIWYAWHANSFDQGFGDPVGPATFPQLVAIPLGLFAFYLILRPDPDPHWPSGHPLLRQCGMLLVLLGYPLLLEPLGFPLSTALGIMIMAWLLGAGLRAGLVSAITISLGLFVIFDQLLGLHLPMLPESFS